MGSFQVDSKQVCETILEELPVGVVVLSTDGTIHHANAFVERLFGYSPGEIVGNPFYMLFGTDEDVPPQTDIVAELNAVAERGGRSEFQLTGRHRDGTESVRQLVIKRCELDGERYLLAVIAASTDENRYKNTLAKMSERLQELATAESPSEIYRPRYYSSNALFCESATTVYAA